MNFRKDFIWGVSTASFQIEGGSEPGERGLSLWDTFCETDGRVFGGHHGRTASDHYHHLDEDVDLLGSLGVKAYRFSVSWPRIIPEGIGKINTEGIDFYNRLIDALLARGIEPHLTVFHWDLPYALHVRGGWLNPDVSDWIEAFTTVLVDAFSDRVTNWITLNEPQCFINEGYKTGQHAPGFSLSDRELALAVHNSLLAHGKIARTIRQSARKPPKITFAQSTPFSSIPYSENDIDSARERQFSLTNAFASSAIIYTDPIYKGYYPEEYLSRFASILPRMGPDDMKTIFQPLDYFGINLYFGDFVSNGPDGSPIVRPREPGFAKTAFGWPVRPECMYWANRFCYERYGLPIMITENGMSGNDWIHTDGKVHDPDRIDYIRSYLTHMHKAIEDGVDIRGYFHWSLIDNFEWARGYSERFGLIYNDFSTGKRTPKDSFDYFREIVTSNQLPSSFA
ncbi:MAG: GH1 family beta-glucosidase [Oscillospiraceae bacterium]|jgi:beta-glucosidase|nr:GH1 family beta-glucosidase [Oscillospiraceae bacterium]